MCVPRHAARGSGVTLLVLALAVLPAAPASFTDIRPGAGEQAASGSGRIEGRVLSAPDRTPVPRARVTMSSPALAATRVTLTSADGAYVFERLPAGAYRVRVSRTGFTTSEAASPERDAVTLAEASAIRIPDILLVRAGVIAGRVLDEDGAPLQGAVVQALARATAGAEGPLGAVSETRTDDTGAYRLGSLRAGTYVVAASDPAFTDSGDEHGPLAYRPTYFPGVPLEEEARPVAVSAGEVTAGVDVRLRLVRPAQVSGQLVAPNNRPLRTAAVVLTPIDQHGMATPTRDVRLQPDGGFLFRNVPPGRYQVRARGEVEAQTPGLVATYMVVVHGRDVANIVMRLEPGASLEGRIERGAGVTSGRVPLAALRVRAISGEATNFADSVSAGVTPDGAFAIRGLLPGRHHLAVDGMPHPWVVASVSRRGTDLTDAPIAVNRGDEIRDVRIALSDSGSEVSGLVRDAQGTPLPDRLVVAGPAVEPWTRASRRVRTARTDAAGRYRIEALPSGEYRLAVAEADEEGDVFSGAAAARARESGQTVVLGERDRRSVDLTAGKDQEPAGRR